MLRQKRIPATDFACSYDVLKKRADHGRGKRRAIGFAPGWLGLELRAMCEIVRSSLHINLKRATLLTNHPC